MSLLQSARNQAHVSCKKLSQVEVPGLDLLVVAQLLPVEDVGSFLKVIHPQVALTRTA